MLLLHCIINVQLVSTIYGQRLFYVQYLDYNEYGPYLRIIIVDGIIFYTLLLRNDQLRQQCINVNF